MTGSDSHMAIRYRTVVMSYLVLTFSSTDDSLWLNKVIRTCSTCIAVVVAAAAAVVVVHCSTCMICYLVGWT